MNETVEALLWIALGAIITYWGYTYFQLKRKKARTSVQSNVLLQQVKKVCKLITVEGDFAEVYHYENVRQRFLSLISSKKKALVVVNAKAHVGFDLRKIEMIADDHNKRIILSRFPQPEVLSVDTDIRYYDKQDGFFNKFAAEDLTELHAEAKQQITDKIPQSGLLDAARQEALETILMMQGLAETIGWTLDYSALKLPESDIKKLEE